MAFFFGRILVLFLSHLSILFISNFKHLVGDFDFVYLTLRLPQTFLLVHFETEADVSVCTVVSHFCDLYFKHSEKLWKVMKLDWDSSMH